MLWGSILGMSGMLRMMRMVGVAELEIARLPSELKSRPLTISRREKNLKQWAKETKDIQEALEKISI